MRTQTAADVQRQINEETLNAILPPTEENAARRATILSCFPGDWRKKDIDVYPLHPEETAVQIKMRIFFMEFRIPWEHWDILHK